MILFFINQFIKESEKDDSLTMFVSNSSNEEILSFVSSYMSSIMGFNKKFLKIETYKTFKNNSNCRLINIYYDVYLINGSFYDLFLEKTGKQLSELINKDFDFISSENLELLNKNILMYFINYNK